MANSNLHAAKAAKNYEFYTQLTDIEKELQHYQAHFKGKVVFCNCGDPMESNFFKYFFLNFKKLGIRKLITTSYKPCGLCIKYTFEGSVGNTPDYADVKMEYIAGNGDFRSTESIQLLLESDIVVTNPPFCLLREYIAQLIKYMKKFLIIGNMNAITYKEVFPHIKDNKLWLGRSWIKEFIQTDGIVKSFGNICWFTNMEHGKRHEELDLYKRYTPEEYPHYDNYDAIDVSKTCDIPMDYDGVMGVPITFLDKYCPEQFEIIGGFNGYAVCDYKSSLLCGNRTEYIDKDGNHKWWTGPTIDKKPCYYRILIRRK